GRRVMSRSERALEVDLDDRVPLGLGHVHEHAVTEDAGVVHQHVEAAELRDRLLDHLLRAGEVADVTRVRNRLAARLADLVDDLRAMRGEHERILSSDASARPGDDHHAAFTEFCHGSISFTRERAYRMLHCSLTRPASRRGPPRALGGNFWPGSWGSRDDPRP